MFRFSIPGASSAVISTRMPLFLPPGSLVCLFLLLEVTSITFPEDMEIVVSASRIEEDARSVSPYVRIIPPEILARAESVLDALKTLPDIAIKANAPGKSFVSMGGFGEGGFARTLVLIDGRPINRADMASVNWQAIPLDKILRIEVIKGPLSSQYGDQAIAGAINIISREPEDFEAWIRTSLSTNLSSKESLTIAWGDDVFSVLGGFHHVNSNPTRERSDADTISATLNLDADFHSLNLGLDGFFAESSYQLPGGLSAGEYRSNPNKANKKEDQVSETTWMIKLDFETFIDPLTIMLPVSWRRLTSEADVIFDSWSSFSSSTLDDVRGSIQGDIELYPNDHITLIPIGGFDVNWSGITVAAFDEKERLGLSSRESAIRREFSLWQRLKAMFGEHWTADAGMRLAAYKISGAGKDVRYMPFVYDFGGVWMPKENWTARLRYGRVFRYPLLDEQVSYFSDPSSINTDLKPEFGHHIAGSLEYSQGVYGADVAAYFIAMNDEIAFDPADLRNANISDTQHIGAVVNVSRIGSTLSLSGSYAFDSARYRNSGRRVPLVPLHSVYGRVLLTPIRAFEFSTDVRLTSGYYKGGDINNEKGTVGGRLSWNLRIDWRPIDSLNIYAKVSNLLDNRMPTEIYWQSYSDEESWYPIEGREFSFGANWHY